MESSVQGLARTTTRDVVVGDVEIPAGEKVLMLYGSANRDAAEFGADADRLDVRREAQRHLGFSSGPHFCIGSHLAKLQAQGGLRGAARGVPGDRGRPLGRCPAPLGVHPGLADASRDRGHRHLPVEEGLHRLAGAVGGEQLGGERGHLVAARVDAGDQVAVEDPLGLAQPLGRAGGQARADGGDLVVERIGGHGLRRPARTPPPRSR